MMMATTRKIWTNPPIVVLVTRPRAQRMRSTIAMVVNIILFFLGVINESIGVSELGKSSRLVFRGLGGDSGAVFPDRRFDSLTALASTFLNTAQQLILFAFKQL